MQTRTMTYTNVDIRRVAECFAADLAMLASRTGAMSSQKVRETAHDVTLMAVHECLAGVHIQLVDGNQRVVAAHEYKVHGIQPAASPWSSDYPGGNNWPRMPDGRLMVVVSYSDRSKVQQLKEGKSLLINWSPSNQPTRYPGMSDKGVRQYSSNGYKWDRTSYIAA